MNLCRKLFNIRLIRPQMCRAYGQIVAGTDECSTPHSRGLVLGVYSNENDKSDSGMLTPVASLYNERVTKGRIMHLLRVAGPIPKRGECRIFYDLEPFFPIVAVCGLGDRCLGYDVEEQLDVGKEAVRIAAATGCRALQQLDANKIYIESFGHAECAAEGAKMALWRYQTFRSEHKREHMPQLEMHVESVADCDYDGWKIGLEKAAAQNLTRELMETPANHLSPTKFAQNVIQALCNSGVSVEVKVRDWAVSQGMASFLAIGNGSCEPPIFLELSYFGTDYKEPPVVLVGQGTTYDSGGVCLKQLDELKNMKGDICGAACVVATCKAVASMRLPINIRGLIPLCEHMIGASAVKPGDVINAVNGKSIEIQNTTIDGVLVLNDTLAYAKHFNPKFIVDIGVSSSDTDETLGESCSAVFTTCNKLWDQIKFAGVHTGDRVWRMPLWDYFNNQMRLTNGKADLQNVGIGRGGGGCKAAAFLREFIPDVPWMHIDAHGIMTTNGDDFPYLKEGMAGRPTRTLIELIAQTTCNDAMATKTKIKAM